MRVLGVDVYTYIWGRNGGEGDGGGGGEWASGSGAAAQRPSAFIDRVC